MAGVSTGIKMSLKIYIDVKSHKVVLAEAGKDFVDFIFHLMHLPLSSVTKLLKDKFGMVGCFAALYKSIESLDTKYYEPNVSKDLVLKPRTAAIVPLLSLNDSQTNISFYRCNNKHPIHEYVSDCPSLTCPCCGVFSDMSSKFSLTYVSPKTLQNYNAAKYVNGVSDYIVADNLEVNPMSITLYKSLTRDFDSLEEKQVEFGEQEGLALLKASLEKEDVLTTVFLGKKI